MSKGQQNQPYNQNGYCYQIQGCHLTQIEDAVKTYVKEEWNGDDGG